MSLTTTSKKFKKGVKIFGVLFVLYYVFIFIIIPNSKQFIRKILPEKNPPNPIYGQLDPLKFSRKQITNESPRYVLDTKDGRLPTNIPTKVTVYKIRKPLFSYLAGTEAEANAKLLGFSTNDLTSDLKGDSLKWKSLLSGGELEIKKSTGQIKLETNFAIRPEEYKPGNINPQAAKAYSVDILKKLNRFEPEYSSENSPVITLGKINNNVISNTLIFADAQFARADFYRSINKLPVLGPDPSQGLIQIYLKNPTLTGSAFNYPKVNINPNSIDTESEATYPIIYPDEAWNEVRRNNGIIVSIRPKDGNVFEKTPPTRVENIYITNISLAYYETPEYMPYLQPIYVFEGNYTTKGSNNGEITLYFPAITKEFVKPIN